MTYEEYEKTKFKEGQSLLCTGKSCTFVEYSECYGVIAVRFDEPIIKRNPVASIAGDANIYTQDVSIEEIKIVDIDLNQ